MGFVRHGPAFAAILRPLELLSPFTTVSCRKILAEPKQKSVKVFRL